MSIKGRGPRAAERRRMERKAAAKATAEKQAAAGEPRALDAQLEPLREFLLAKPGSEEEFPFGPQVMVFKVGGKIFAFLAWEEAPIYVSLKCEPERSQELREEYDAINGAYHLNKKHWHSIAMDGSVEMDLTYELIDHSYDLIVATLPGKVRERLQGLSD